MEQQALCVFVATSAYLYLKMTANSLVQGYCRFRGLGFSYPEDRSLLGGPEPQSNDPHPLEDLHWRAGSAWRNDLENIPIFLVAALCGLLTGIPAEPYGWLLILFASARTLHTAFLLKSWQPTRFLAFATGQTVTGVLFLWSLWRVGF